MRRGVELLEEFVDLISGGLSRGEVAHYCKFYILCIEGIIIID